MDFKRIKPSIAVNIMQDRHVTIVGGAHGLAGDLVRCGLGSLTLVDFDTVEPKNIPRQDFSRHDVGQYKTIATARTLRAINPSVHVDVCTRDFCSIARDEFDELFGRTDLFIYATDFFPAQARGNVECLRLNKPGLWIGLYPRGRAGEIVYHVPGTTPACYRCVCDTRYAAFAGSTATRVSSSGGTILDLHLVDAIAGQLAVGILTRGTKTRFGRLIEDLGNRNLLQVKIDPRFRLNKRDIFAEHLGHQVANFSFTTIALSMDPEPECPDCATLTRKPARNAVSP